MLKLLRQFGRLGMVVTSAAFAGSSYAIHLDKENGPSIATGFLFDISLIYIYSLVNSLFISKFSPCPSQQEDWALGADGMRFDLWILLWQGNGTIMKMTHYNRSIYYLSL
jgi:hypothetical protein